MHIGLIVFVIYILTVLFKISKKESFFTITLVYMMVAPQIKISEINFDIDGLYCIIIFLIVLLLLKRKKILIYKNYKNYLLLIGFNFLLYLITTLIYNKNLTFTGLSSIIGFIKLPLIIILTSNIFEEEITEIEKYDKAFKITIIINLIGVLLQSIFGSEIRNFFENMYVTNSYGYYTTLSDNIVYNRKFGFFGSPMILGVYSTFSFLFFLFRYNKTKSKENLIYIIVSIFVGVLSLSKSFLMGVPTCFVIYMILGFFSKENKLVVKKQSFQFLLIIFLCSPLIIAVLSKFYDFLIGTSNSSITYYLKFFKNPLSVFNTRYNIESTNILLNSTYEIIKKHPILGVGFQSINGEFLGDSSYVLALHNGGIMSLVTIIIYYIAELIKNIKIKECIIFIIYWILSGFAMPTLFAQTWLIPFIMFYHIHNINLQEKRK